MRRRHATTSPARPPDVETVAHFVAGDTAGHHGRLTAGPLELAAGLTAGVQVLAPWPMDRGCSCDEAEVDIGGTSTCARCYGEEVASAARAGALRAVVVWGTITITADEVDELRAPQAVVEYALGPVEPAASEDDPPARPDVVTHATVRLRDLAQRIDELAASTWDSPWHEAALALRRTPVEGPVGAAVLAVAALEALVAHAKYRRAYPGAR